mmetsp:Transcript_17374/g.22831  ORF Transcript_17374/g.22831 Transcript_17374/m.22831 type:complete len:144 (-) Transcript_17374:447-878(-)
MNNISETLTHGSDLSRDNSLNYIEKKEPTISYCTRRRKVKRQDYNSVACAIPMGLSASAKSTPSTLFKNASSAAKLSYMPGLKYTYSNPTPFKSLTLSTVSWLSINFTTASRSTRSFLNPTIHVICMELSTAVCFFSILANVT